MSKRHFTQTDSIVNSINDFAKNFKIATKNVDFKIVNVFTKYKNESHKDFQDTDKMSIGKLRDPEFLIDPSLVIQQSYELELYEKGSAKVPKVHIGSNRDKTKVVFVVGAGAKLKYSEKLEDFIRNNIKKQMALYGYLIEIWDYEEELNEFFSVLKNAKKIKYGQKQYIVIAKSPLPRVKPVNDALVERYKQSHNERDEYDRIDYKKRGFAFGVKKGDIVLQYTKPQEGRAGRDCNGKFLPVNEPTVEQSPSFSTSENITVKEGENSIDYIAQKSGYVTFENNTYDIGHYLEVDVIDFKTTGDIDLGLDSDVRIVVNGQEDMKDAIGQGIEVNCKEINVMQGTIGSGVKVRAAIVNISSTTHQESKIFATEASINVHNGYLKAKKAYIKRLEGGIVEAEEVIVEQAVGGEIRGTNVHIHLLTSNARIYASNLIEITTLKGEDNEFMIDPTLSSGLKDDIVNLQNEIDKLKTARVKIYKEYTHKKATFKGSESVVNTVKRKITEHKEQGIKIPQTYIEQYKGFQALVKSIRMLNEELILLNDEIDRLKSELDIKQSIVLNAKVVSRNSWSGYNKVSFALISPEIIKQTTTEGKKNVIMLREDSDGEFQIESQELEYTQSQDSGDTNPLNSEEKHPNDSETKKDTTQDFTDIEELKPE